MGYKEARPNQTRLLNLFDDIGCDWEDVAVSLMNYMSDDDVGDWAEMEGYFDSGCE